MVLRSPGSQLRVVLIVLQLRRLLRRSLSQTGVGAPPCLTVSLPIRCLCPLADFTVSGQVSGCIVEQDLSIGDYSLPAQKVVAARELRGDLAAEGFSMRYVKCSSRC